MDEGACLPLLFSKPFLDNFMTCKAIEFLVFDSFLRACLSVDMFYPSVNQKKKKKQHKS